METPLQNDEKLSLFAHPLTFAITHLAFPILATLACVYLYWVTCDALEGVLASLGDRPLDGWFFLDGEDGGKVAVPCRKGNGGSAVLGAVVFANLKGATKIGGAWAEGAKAWELENNAFLKPALDARRELLELTRKTGDAPGFLILLLLFAPLALWRRKFAGDYSC